MIEWMKGNASFEAAVSVVGETEHDRTRAKESGHTSGIATFECSKATENLLQSNSSI
jgi:hypothetical protein